MGHRIRRMAGLRFGDDAYLVRYPSSQWRNAAWTVQAWACEGLVDPGDANALVTHILEAAVADGELVG